MLCEDYAKYPSGYIKVYIPKVVSRTIQSFCSVAPLLQVSIPTFFNCNFSSALFCHFTPP